MYQALLELSLFTAKSIILFVLILLVLLTFFVLLAKAKEKIKGRLIIKNLNKKNAEITEELLAEILPKKLFKKSLKQKKLEEKVKHNTEEKPKNVYVINFHGDLKASAVNNLREEINAILSVATSQDEVVVRLDSAGGVVHGYGLAAAQLLRIRNHDVPLTVSIDKVAASGGYMMACVANKILSAPFAIIGSIGVVVQLPNFHRLLKEKNIDFEQLTAGEYKRTLSLFGENTEEGREKLQHEIEDVHQMFKNLIASHRQQIDINKVATGEYWMGQQALGLHLVDEIKTSDEYLMQCAEHANLFEIAYEIKKPMISKFAAAAKILLEKIEMIR